MTLDWTPPTELPDLRRAVLVGLYSETKDDRLRADMGSGWSFRAGHICGISTAFHADGGVRGVYLPMRHPDSQNFDPEQVYRWIRDHIAAGVRFVTQNGLYDWGWLRAEAGIKMPDSIDEVSALATMIDENRFRYSLESLCAWRGLPGKDETLLREAALALGMKKKGGKPQAYISQMPAHAVGPYAEADAVNTLLLYENLDPILDQEGTRAAYRLECDILPMVLEMRRRGIRIDLDAAEQARALLLQKRDVALEALSKEIGSAVGMDEVRSKKWLVETFDRLEIKYPHTEKGNPSFTGGKLGWMAGHVHWLPRSIAIANKYEKAIYFVQTLLDHQIDGRVHAEINPHRSEDNGTKSFRFSYSDPALQQMPARDEELAPLIRGLFLPEEGEVWAKPDASQQEFRFVAHYANQHGLRKAAEAVARYREDPNTDFHLLAATITALERKDAKGVNFAKIYGAGPEKFAQMIGKPLAEAKQIYERYDQELPFLHLLGEIYKSRAHRQGYITLYDGARRHFNRWAPGGKWKKKAGPCELEEAQGRIKDSNHPWYRRPLHRADARTALNALIQGSAARHTKLWMRACWREGIVPLLQMHDCLDCSVNSREQAELVARLGEEAVKLDVPMRVDLKYGRSWGDAKHSWDELHGAPPTKTIEEFLPLQPADGAALPDCPAEPAAEAAMKPELLTTSPPILATPHLLVRVTQADINEINAGLKDWGIEPITTREALIHTTIFRDEKAQSLKVKNLTLGKMRDLVLTTTAGSKIDLPLLKLAIFGTARTEKNCLRHNANVTAITGVEGDYDGKVIAFEDAVTAIKTANLTALVFTSPSYRKDAPKWRVLLPTSKQLPPGERLKLMSRINGVLGGILAGESFVLSQSFYFGSVNNNPEHRAVLLDGDFIDQRPDLDAAALGKQGKTEDEYVPDEDCIDDILTGADYHTSMLTLSARWAAQGMNSDDVEQQLLDLMNQTTAPKDDRWQARRDDIHRTVESAMDKFATENEYETPKSNGAQPATASEKHNATPSKGNGAAGNITHEITEPVDLWGRFDAPPLPRGLLPDVLERFAFEEAELTGADPSGLAMAALAVCAAALPDHTQLQVKRYDPHWREAVRLWVGLIGNPSTKKTPIIVRATKPLKRLDAELWRKYLTEKEVYDALSSDARKQSPRPKQTRLRLEDTTIEAAQEVLKDSPDGVLCIQDELSGWFGAMDKYAGRGAAKDRGFWLQSFHGGAYAVNRITRGSFMIENLSVSLLGGIQPDPIRKIAEDTVDDGLLQRLIPIVLRRGNAGKDAPTGQAAREYDDLIVQLHTRVHPGIPLEFNDEALTVRETLEQKHLDLMAYEVINRKLAAHIGKYDGLFARLCLLWHCVEGITGLTVTEHTARRVADFMRRFLLPHATAFYAGMLALSDDHDRLTNVAGYILAKKLTRITNRDVQRGNRAMRGLDRQEMESIFHQLEALGWLFRMPGPYRSAPPHWPVNPEVHHRFAERATREAVERAKEHEMLQEMFRGGSQ